MSTKILSRTLAALTAIALIGGGCALPDAMKVSAYSYDSITGAVNVTGFKAVKYQKVITVNVVTDFGADNTGSVSATAAIQNALRYARDNASDKIQVKIVIPKGTYSMTKSLIIGSNTHLYMEKGAVIRKDYTKPGCMLQNIATTGIGGYGAAKNIIIEGGCFDGNVNYDMWNFTNVRFAHMTNLLVKNVTFKGNLNAHHLEFGGVRNVTVQGCDFSDYHGEYLKEAIQFDMMNNSSLFPGFEPYDDTTCKNVIIRKNNFHDVMRGIGSHSSTLGSYFTDFLIENNTFTNIGNCTILMQSYKNTTVSGNKMNNVGSGIILRNMSPFEDNKGYNDPVSNADLESRLDNDLNTVIKNNVINAAPNADTPSSVGIQLFGKLIEGGANTDFDHQVEGVRVTGNEFNVAGTCIQLDDVNGIKIDSNKLHYTGDKSAEYDLVSVKNSSETLFSGNTAVSPPDDSFTVSSGRVYLQDMSLNNSADGCCGVRSGSKGSVFGWDMDVTTTGAASSPIYAERESGSMVISGGSYSSAGEDSPAALSKSVMAINGAELKGGKSEAVRVEDPAMMYLYGCKLSTDSSDAAAVICGTDPFGADSKLSRLYVEGGSISAKNDAIFTTNCQSEVILHSTEVTSENGYLLNASSDPTRWGWGRKGCGGAKCSLTMIRENAEGDIGCDSLSELSVYLTDFSDYTGITAEYSAGENLGERGHITMNIDPGSAWIITGSCSVSKLHTAGEVKDINGRHAVITDRYGNILRDGKSPYTVTVLDEYGERPDLHSAGEIYSFEDFRLSRTSIDPTIVDDNSPEPEYTVRGDVNGNGSLEIGDLIMVASHVKGVKAISSADAEKRADVNRDGIVDIKDTMLIAAAIKGIRPL